MGRHADPPGVGTKLVRLKDVPRGLRMEAIHRVLRTCKDEKEALRLLELAADPGEVSGRIAA